jgi:uncharacterized protein (TIGR02117 family)
MKSALIHTFTVMMSVLLCACTSPPRDLFPPGSSDPSRTIYLVRHGWHAGIVVRRADIPPDVWPQHNDFPDSEYLELGWGDKDYYMMLSPHLGITIKAGLLPTASVLHVVGFSGSVTHYFPHSEVIRIELSETGFHQLCSYIENAYALDEAGRSQSLGPSLYGSGHFYLSRENYHAFNTCNVWTSRGLREAGVHITPAANLTVDALMANAARYGEVVQNTRPALE